jgi:hypothetical protein
MYVTIRSDLYDPAGKLLARFARFVRWLDVAVAYLHLSLHSFCVKVDCNLIFLPSRSGNNLARRVRHIVGNIDENVPLLLQIVGYLLQSLTSPQMAR